MFDLYGATKAVQSNALSDYLLAEGITAAMAATKASWNVAINGVYTLLEPKIHFDFYRKEEIDSYHMRLNEKIDLDIVMPFNEHTHMLNFLIQSTITPQETMLWIDPNMIPLVFEFFMEKFSRPIDTVSIAGVIDMDMIDVELGENTFEAIEVYNRSPVLGLL